MTTCRSRNSRGPSEPSRTRSIRLRIWWGSWVRGGRGRGGDERRWRWTAGEAGRRRVTGQDMPFAKQGASRCTSAQMKALLRRHRARRIIWATWGWGAWCTRCRPRHRAQPAERQPGNHGEIVEGIWRTRRCGTCTSTSAGTRWRSTSSHTRDDPPRGDQRTEALIGCWSLKGVTQFFQTPIAAALVRARQLARFIEALHEADRERSARRRRSSRRW